MKSEVIIEDLQRMSEVHLPWRELDGKTPFETGEQALFEILQVHRCAVRRENQLFPGLVEMVEHIEERILRSLALEVLDIIHEEDIDPHVVCEEIGKLVPHRSVHVLGLELIPGHIEDDQFWIFLLDFVTDRLNQVSLAETGSREDEQRVEWRFPGGHCDALPCGDAHPVALPFDKILETVLRLEPWIDPDPLRPGEYEGAGVLGRMVGADRNGRIDGRVAHGRGIDHRLLVPDRADHIGQLRIGADRTAERALEKRQERIFDILPEELRRYLDRQFRLYEGNRPDGFEPGIELLRINVVGNDLQTVVPYGNMSIVYLHQGLFKTRSG